MSHQYDRLAPQMSTDEEVGLEMTEMAETAFSSPDQAEGRDGSPRRTPRERRYSVACVCFAAIAALAVVVGGRLLMRRNAVLSPAMPPVPTALPLVNTVPVYNAGGPAAVKPTEQDGVGAESADGGGPKVHWEQRDAPQSQPTELMPEHAGAARGQAVPLPVYNGGAAWEQHLEAGGSQRAEWFDGQSVAGTGSGSGSGSGSSASTSEKNGAEKGESKEKAFHLIEQGGKRSPRMDFEGFRLLGRGPCRDSSGSEPSRYECRAADTAGAQHKCHTACVDGCLGWQVCDLPACSELCVVFVAARNDDNPQFKTCMFEQGSTLTRVAVVMEQEPFWSCYVPESPNNVSQHEPVQTSNHKTDHNTAASASASTSGSGSGSGSGSESLSGVKGSSDSGAAAASGSSRLVDTDIFMEQYIDMAACSATFNELQQLKTTHVAVSLLGSAQDVFFDNFVTRLVTLHSFGPLVAMCLDIDAVKFCNKIRQHFSGFELRCVPPAGNSPLYGGGAWKKDPWMDQVVTYGDATYYQIIRLKPAVLYHCLNYKMAVLLTDIDVVYLSSPFLFWEGKKYGIDGLWASTTGGGANTGIVYGVPTKATLTQAHKWAVSVTTSVQYDEKGEIPVEKFPFLKGKYNYMLKDLKWAADWDGNKDDPKYKCDHFWVSVLINRNYAVVNQNDQDNYNHLRSCDPDFKGNQLATFNEFALNCDGCNKTGLVASHCIHGPSKIPAMKSCPGWWKISIATVNDSHYCGSGKKGECTTDNPDYLFDTSSAKNLKAIQSFAGHS